MNKSFKDRFITGIKAFITGAMMTIPGVSGGSTAMVLGEYDNLIASIPGIFKKETIVKSIIYLAIFCFFGVLGIVVAAKPLTYLIANFALPVMYFILGAIIGSIPMMVSKAQLDKKNWPHIFYALIGIVIVYGIELLPPGLLSPSMDFSFSSILIQLIGGILISVGLILPGISVSYLLVVLGLYEPVLTLVGNLDIIPLIPLGVGGVLGVLLLTGILKIAMEKKPKVTYMIILGFLLTSMVPIYPGLPSGWNIPISLISFFIGAGLIYYLSKKEM